MRVIVEVGSHRSRWRHSRMHPRGAGCTGNGRGISTLKQSLRSGGGGWWAAIAISLATALASPGKAAAGQPSDGIGAAVDSLVISPDFGADRDAPAGDGETVALESGDTLPAPHWCNTTSALVDDIHRLGGQSVMRMELDRGRVLERYWNDTEEVTIEHGADGNSCLLEMRQRRSAGLPVSGER